MDSEPWLIVGLGNPGPSYASTRHNVGYMVLDELASRAGTKLGRHKRAHADVGQGRLDGQRVTLLRSRSFMNESGGPVKAAVDYGKFDPDHLVVIQDELDIPFGAVRLKLGGGDGGHNGLKSIRKSLGTGDYYRIRVGVDRPPGQQDTADYVLKAFSGAQRKELPTVIADAADAVEALLTLGLAPAQNKFHTQ